MLPAHGSPVKQYSRMAVKITAAASSEVFSLSLLHSWIILLDPRVALQMPYMHTHTHLRTYTFLVWQIQHGDPLLSPPCQLCLHGSSGNVIYFPGFGPAHQRGESTNSNSQPA